MISEKNYRMENHFWVGIFEIFHFQKHAPNMVNWRVKNFQKSKIRLSGPRPGQYQPRYNGPLSRHPAMLTFFSVPCKAEIVRYMMKAKMKNQEEKYDQGFKIDRLFLLRILLVYVFQLVAALLLIQTQYEV